MTKIDIFSGFLGAGKTTLIKKLIKEAYNGEKVVLIENEFGEIGIDGGFMKDAGIEVNEMNSGCICCSLVGDFAEALKKVLCEYSPDRILIEPSGVGKLSDVIRAVQGVTDENTVLNAYCAVVDAKKCKMYMKNFGEFFNDQIESASCIILSHTDSISEDKLSECISLIKEHNADAQIVTTPWAELSGENILAVMEKDDTLETDIKKLEDEHICPECGHHHAGHNHVHETCNDEAHHHHHHHDEECHCDEHHHHHHDEECHCDEHHHHDEHCHCHEHEHEHHHHHHTDDVFTSWGCETVRTYTQEEIKTLLDALSNEEAYGTVLRAKGIVKGADEWIHFDYVPNEADVRTGAAAAIGRICVIGAKINEDELKKLFQA